MYTHIRRTYDRMRFNPTLVRLAQSPEALTFCRTKSFNPTLVRLAPGTRTRTRTSSASFNPTLVRLARIETILEYALDRGFNPTLVRLAQISASCVLSSACQFQSHLGSISTLERWEKLSEYSIVSIPPWFD